jgi:hypothetical protein
MKRNLVLLALFLAILAGLVVASRVWKHVAPPVLTFTEECLKDGNMWHEMAPLRNGTELPGEKKPGCMTADAQQHFSDAEEYRAAKNPGNSIATLDTGAVLQAGVPGTLHFSIRGADGSVPELFREHERYLHVIVISKDKSVFKHVHPDDQRGFSEDDIASADFALPFTFPMAGEYVIAIDFANKLKHESRQFHVTVEGGPSQGEEVLHASPQRAAGLDISFDHSLPITGELTTLRFNFERNVMKVTDLSPYLGAAMHLAVVKEDLSEFVHAHGETHPPGYVPPANAGTTHIHAPPPEKFGPTVESHVIFPSEGMYTVFAEFKRNGEVSNVKFSVRVER